jgi:very-short-patch-repair endonuclease
VTEFKSRLEKTRKKLLDLTKRNKLINYKRPSKTRNLKIIDESAEFIYKHLVFDETPFKFKFIPEPEILQLENKKLLDKKDKLKKIEQSTIFDEEKKVAQDKIQGIFEQLENNQLDALLTAEEQAKNLGFITSSELPEIDLTSIKLDDKYTDDYLQTLHYPSDLEKILKKIELNARSIIQETGANMLYLILGVLEWKEKDNSDIKIKSPLINIPITLRRGSLNKKTSTYEYVIEYDGSAIDTNKSLAEKLKNDFNIELPELTEELSFNEYMTEVKKICNNKQEWKIKQEISIDFLQFSKILMYKDLDTENWDDGALENNEVLNDIFLGKETSGVSYAPEEYDIDNNSIALNAPLIMDADSSQHSAIVDVLNGKNVVIEGPPGTGKSQTISNMIASLISNGKSVLFVSEKLSALDVVYKRLASNELGDFCLELHSHKTQKLKVLESLKKRIDSSYDFPYELENIKVELENKKIILKEHLDILHLKYGKIDKKIFEIFWLVEKYNIAEKYLKFNIDGSELLTLIDVNNRIEELLKYKSYVNNYNFNSFYWNGFIPTNFDFVDIEIFIDKFKILNSKYYRINFLFNELNIKIEDEVKECKQINLFVSEFDNIDSINQKILNVLKNKNLNVFQDYIDLFLKHKKVIKQNQDNIIDYNKLSKDELNFLIDLEQPKNKSVFELLIKKEEIQKYNQDNIIDYDKLSNDDKSFLINLNEENLIQLNNYVESKQKYELLKLDKINYIRLEQITIDETRIIEDILSIEEFLYSEISLDTLDDIYKLNEDILTIVALFENDIKDLSEYIKTSNISKISEIKNIHVGIELLSEIDKELYINCTLDTGTIKYIEIARKGNKEASNLKSLLIGIENIFITENIYLHDITYFENLKLNLVDKKDSFFKIFSTSFKKAKHEYIGLLIGEAEEDINIWIEQLDNLINYLTMKKEYENNIEFQNLFQNLFQGLSTNWNEIIKLHNWGEKVRSKIKLKSYIDIILKGKEQTYLSLMSYLNSFTKNLQDFNELIISLEIKYKASFVRKLYRRVVDIDFIDLKNILDNINEKTLEYIPFIKTLNINEKIEIKRITCFIKEYSDSKNTFEKYKNIIEIILSKYIVNKSDIDINKFLTNIISILEKQNLKITHMSLQLSDERKLDKQIIDLGIELKELVLSVIQITKKQTLGILKVSALLKEENDIDLKLNDTINYIEDTIKYKVAKTDAEIIYLTKHIDIISLISKTNINDNLKELILEQFSQTLEIFKNISNEYIFVIELNNALSEYGTFEKNKFYEKETIKYSDLINKLNLLENNKDNLSIWLDYNELLNRMKKFNLVKIVNSIESNVLSKNLIIEAYCYNFYNSLLRTVFKEYKILNKFSRLSHEEVIKTFKNIDLKLLQLNKQLVAFNASKREMPISQSGGIVSTFTNKKLIEHEISKKKRHIPIRKLIERAGEAIQSLKPCFMMSPLSVAQYLPPNSMKFDVLLVDEASQLRPEEALGIIARTKQVVIVGDPKQLPPTSFFDTLRDESDNEEDTILDESESILDSCIDLYSPVRRLKWHYRSQHESLIDFSNQHFYDNDLIVFPSPTSISSNELGLKHTYIENAIYQGGAGKRYNKLEAKIVIEHIEKQIKEFPNKSLGIGTFNTSQRDLIQQLIDEKEKINPLVANYISKWKDSSEPFFIKNLESLQGDERDVIFISTTYGPDKNTAKVMQRFGPINQDSGWRRLNVLITRSKQKMHIFTSMQSSEILINENSSRGVIALKSFINFLETGILFNKPKIIDGKGFDSPFEESVYQLLSDIGVTSVPQVGVAGYFIDLAIVSEEKEDFILAIECDGATYHSSKSSRDRDRLKDEVLNKLGWKVYRIWSVDWYRNRQNEVQKLIKIIKEQQAIYSERYKHRTVFTPYSRSVKIEEIKNSANVKGHIDKEIIEDHNTKEHSDGILQQNQYTQSFLSDDATKKLLIELRDNEISKEFTIDKRCILSSMMLDQFLKHKPLDMDEFRSKIPMKLRTGIEREQLVYMNTIFEILDMNDE